MLVMPFLFLSSYVGMDATGDFEDIGHSSGAREILKEYLIGTLALDEEVLTPHSVDQVYNIKVIM
jgi:cytochrome b involved in lipid metabolism